LESRGHSIGLEGFRSNVVKVSDLLWDVDLRH